MNWSRIVVTKCVLLTVLCLVTLQYLVNVCLIKRNDSVILLNVIDTSFGKLWNQTHIFAQDSVRSSVAKLPKKMKRCNVISPHLRGHIKVNTQIAAWAQIEEENSVLEPGGLYRPTDCIPRNRVAIVIPFRDRDIHLKIFMRNIHPFLQSQQLDYGIFVIEMAINITFNRALLMNVGFVEAMKRYDYQCFIFHDVDLLPEDDRNLYTCPAQPRHMSVAIDSLNYKLPYPQIFGGVSAINTQQFQKVNGFSNIFFGWGGEDDDMYRRLFYGNLTVTRYSPEVARYKMLVHVKDHGNPERHSLLRTSKARQKTDGLSSLKYNVIKLEFRSLYTWILISVNQSEIIENEPIHKLTLKNLKNVKQSKKDVKGKLQNVNKIERKNQVQMISGKQDKLSGLTFTNQQRNAQKQNSLRASDIDKTKAEMKMKPVEKKIIKAPVGNPKSRRPTQISWIPKDFKGILPANLTKFLSLPVIRKVKPAVRKEAKQKIAKSFIKPAALLKPPKLRKEYPKSMNSVLIQNSA